jgi:hypothetical protein
MHGGRYLFAYGPVNTLLLDSQAKLKANVSLNLGLPKSEHGQPDVAYGIINGKPVFLLVYGDGNNQYCTYGIIPCILWPGVWGTYIDPIKIDYSMGPNNNPFPISKIAKHIFNKNASQARVAYNKTAKAFFVVWREIPEPTVKKEENRTYIRGNKIDYLVLDGDVSQSGIREPYVNRIISTVTGNWPLKPINGFCASNENPFFPDIAAIAGANVAVFWQEKTQSQTNTIYSIKGNVVSVP